MSYISRQPLKPILTGIHLTVIFLWLALGTAACRTADWVSDPAAADFGPLMLDRTPEQFGDEAAYAHYTAAELLYDSGDLSGARDELAAALVADDTAVYLMVRLASVLIETGEFRRAEKLIEKALKAEPANGAVWLALARYHMANGAEEKAEAAARQAIRVAPGEVDARLWLAEIKRRSGDVESAVELLTQAIEAAPNSASAHLALGRALVSLGRYAEACRYLGIAVRLQPGRTTAIRELARAARDAGDELGAADLMEFALERDPTDVKLRLELIEQLFALGEPARAERHVLSLPALEGDDPEQALERASLFERAALYYEAREIVQHQFVVHPRNRALRLALAGIEIRLGRLEAAALLLDDPEITWSPVELHCRKDMMAAIQRWPEPSPLCDTRDGSP
jgi:Tfp pilus assembly protein PilF